MSATLFTATTERIHLLYDSRMDHPLKAEKGNEGSDRERNSEITVIWAAAEAIVAEGNK